MATGRNLMSSEQPYIHSNYENFLSNYSFGAGHAAKISKITGINYGERRERETGKMEVLYTKLKNATREFLGEEPKRGQYKISDFLSKTTNASEFQIEFINAFLEFTQTNDFYFKVKNLIDNITEEAFNKIFKQDPNFSKAIEEALKETEGDLLNAITLALSKNFKNAKTETETIKLGQRKYLSDLINDELLKTDKLLESVEDVVNHIFKDRTVYRSEFSKVLKSRLKELFSKVEKSNITFAQFIIQYCDNGFKQYFKDYLAKKQLNIYNEDQYEEMYHRLVVKLRNSNSDLNKPISKIYKTDIGEMRGEELVRVAFTTANGIAIEIGSKKEVDTRKIGREIANKNFSKSKIKSLTDDDLEGRGVLKDSIKSLDKQSRSDLIITNPHTRRSAGVQSKNYIQQFLDDGVTLKNQSIEIFTPHSNETIFQFVNRLENYSGNDIDADSLSYVLANMVWFKYAGSIDRGEMTNSQPVEDPGLTPLMLELSNFLIDLLGVSYSQFSQGMVHKVENVFSEFSNLFYLINNEFMIPTFMIVEDIAKAMEINSKAVTNQESFVKMTMTSSFFENDGGIDAAAAEQLKQQKAEAAGEPLIFTRQNTYGDAVLSVGQKKGGEIIQKNTKNADKIFNIKKLYLDFNLNSLQNFK